MHLLYVGIMYLEGTIQYFDDGDDYWQRCRHMQTAIANSRRRSFMPIDLLQELDTALKTLLIQSITNCLVGTCTKRFQLQCLLPRCAAHYIHTVVFPAFALWWCHRLFSHFSWLEESLTNIKTSIDQKFIMETVITAAHGEWWKFVGYLISQLGSEELLSHYI